MRFALVAVLVAAAPLAAQKPAAALGDPIRRAAIADTTAAKPYKLPRRRPDLN